MPYNFKLEETQYTAKVFDFKSAETFRIRQAQQQRLAM